MLEVLILYSVMMMLRDVGVGFCFSFWRLPFTVHSRVLRLASCILRLASCVWWLNGSHGAFCPAPAGGDYHLDRLGHSVGLAGRWRDDGGTMALESGKWTTHEYLLNDRVVEESRSGGVEWSNDRTIESDDWRALFSSGQLSMQVPDQQGQHADAADAAAVKLSVQASKRRNRLGGASNVGLCSRRYHRPDFAWKELYQIPGAVPVNCDL